MDENHDPAARAAALAALGQLIRGVFGSQLVGVAAKLGVPAALRDGPRSAAEIAEVVGADARTLHRALRALVLHGVLIELPDGRFALGAMGELLLPGAPGAMGDHAILVHDATARALGSLFEAIKTGKPAFEIAFGRPFFAHLDAEPELGRLFDRLMSSMSSAVAAAIPAVYSFTGARRIVDVGGGRGHCLAAILEANPEARGVLFDVPHVVAGAEAHLASAGVLSRCEIVAGDFFASVPAGDVHLLSWVLHDWDDDACRTILDRCRRAAAPGGRILVLERILPERVAEDPAVILADLGVLALLPGRERTLGEYRALIEGAGFQVTRVIAVPDPRGAPPRNLVEAVAV
jgi:hypothetical protein